MAIDNFAKQARSAAQMEKSVKAIAVGSKQMGQQVSFAANQWERGRITMDNFGQAFHQATSKVLLWQTAIIAVYGVMRKIGEVIQTWKELELSLARISVTTNEVGKGLMLYFEKAASIAIKFGMPIEETMRGMDLALRATAKYASEGTEKRVSVATQLLTDVSVLANLTGMQYAQAVDILVGSLRQSGMELSQGKSLLDKWVAVAKSAAVSVNELSQGFAIMADAARAAGLTVDQVNGVIAALSETVTLGPVQVGNAIRAIMSTLYNPGSITKMQQFGLAVRNTEGDVRNFWDVMSQLSAMRMGGVLSEGQWLEIAKAAGAGQRRYAQFLALLNNWETAIRVAGISQSASNQAYEANQRIIDTLANTWDRFTAAQKQLWFVQGQGTGLIKDITGAFSGLTSALEYLAKMPDAIWSLIRAITFLGTAMLALKMAKLIAGWVGLVSILGKAKGLMMALPALMLPSSQGIRWIDSMYTKGVGVSDPGYYKTGPGRTSYTRMPVQPMFGGQPMGRPLGAAGLGGQVGSGWLTSPWRANWAQGMTGKMGTIGKGIPSFGGMLGAAGMGAAAYGITRDWATTAGTTIAGGIGAALGGPVGMIAGGAIGGFIGSAFSGFIESELDRTRKYFERMEETFKVTLSPEAQGFEDALNALAEGTPVPEFPGGTSFRGFEDYIEDILKGQGDYGSLEPEAGGAGYYGSYVGGTESLERTLEEKWKKGIGIPLEMLKNLRDSLLITDDQFEEFTTDTTGGLAVDWEDATSWVNMYIGAAAKVATLTEGTDEYVEALNNMLVIELQLARIRGESGGIDRFLALQIRTKELFQDERDALSSLGEEYIDLSLKEWQANEVANIYNNTLKFSAKDVINLTELYGSLGYAFASYKANVEAANAALVDMGEEGSDMATYLPAVFEELARFEPDLYRNLIGAPTDITDTAYQLKSMKLEMQAIQDLSVKGTSIGDVFAQAGIPMDSFVQTLWETPELINVVISALNELVKNAPVEVTAEIVNITAKLNNMYRTIIAGKNAQLIDLALADMTGDGTSFLSRGEIRLVGTEELENINKYGLQNVVTSMENLLATQGIIPTGDRGKFTFLDPMTGLNKTVETTSLVIQMAMKYIQENTEMMQRGLEAEYNIPAGYAVPTRYMYYKATGSTEFGEYHQTLASMFQDWATSQKDAIDNAIGAQTNDQTASIDAVANIEANQLTVLNRIDTGISLLGSTMLVGGAGYVPEGEVKDAIDIASLVETQRENLAKYGLGLAGVGLGMGIGTDESQTAMVSTANDMVKLNLTMDTSSEYLRKINISSDTTVIKLTLIADKLETINRTLIGENSDFKTVGA